MGALMRHPFILALVTGLALASPALAERVQTFPVRQEDGGYCESDLQIEIKKTKGIKKYRFDRAKLQVVVTLADGVRDDVVLDAIKRARARCTMDMTAQGAPARPVSDPKNADIRTLSKKGESIGSMKQHLVAGKYTVFDVYADWCGPCQLVDRKLREILATRQDIAVRKLNVVDFNTPLAREIGSKLKGLPYVVVFDPKGKRTDIIGGNLNRLVATLNPR
jgi:thiol-disulfide isomerase/thioredoxin